MINIGVLEDNNRCKTSECAGLGKQVKLYKDSSYIDGYKIKCARCIECSNIVHFINNNFPRMKINVLIHASFLYLKKIKNKQIIRMLPISEETFIKLKKSFIDVLIRMIDDDDKIGGENKTI